MDYNKIPKQYRSDPKFLEQIRRIGEMLVYKKHQESEIEVLECRIRAICFNQEIAEAIIMTCQEIADNNYPYLLQRVYDAIASGEPPNQVLAILSTQNK